MELVSPSLAFESEFAAFFADFATNDRKNADYYLQGVTDFGAYVQRLQDEAAGVNLKAGHVPCSHYWLFDDKGEMVGVIRVRHHIRTGFLSFEAGHIGYDIAPSSRGRGLGKAMLALALPKVKALGIDTALITAQEDNMASRRVIEANGGQLENVVMGQVFPTLLARYWVSCE
uniref:GNAT family N-acetyltransferase n=1 Tax=Thaumasiovibrio occultus TaxID=1891184 RepID=UPI000B3514D7|nr:GNAT family N-acetyltransferase [Thaumasiovibrio occultus]